MNECFRDSLISPKHFLTILKIMSSYRGPSFVLNERKTSLNSFIDSDFFPLYCAFDLRNEFEKFRTFLAKFGPEFVKKLLSYSAIYFISVFFFNTKFIR